MILAAPNDMPTPNVSATRLMTAGCSRLDRRVSLRTATSASTTPTIRAEFGGGGRSPPEPLVGVSPDRPPLLARSMPVSKDEDQCSSALPARFHPEPERPPGPCVTAARGSEACATAISPLSRSGFPTSGSVTYASEACEANAAWYWARR